MERIDEALIDDKLTRMKSKPGSVFGIIFIGLLILFYSYNTANYKILFPIASSIIFIGLYIKHFVIDPLIRKIEFLEMDIKQLKSATV